MKDKKKITKIILIFLVILLPILAYAQKELEVDYPIVPGSAPPIEKTSLPEYVKYIFNFAIAVSGIAGVSSFVMGGFRFLASAGNAGQISMAKSQMFSALFGLIILFGSVVMINMINPQILKFEMPQLSAVPTDPLPPPPSYTIPTRDILQRVKELAQGLSPVPEAIKNTAKEIETLTEKCDCKNTKPVCGCEGKSGALGADLSCRPKTCYSGNDSHPCKDKDKIKNLQKNMADHKDLILYYKERIEAEKADISNNINTVINKQIAWYNSAITKRQEIRSQRSGPAADLEESVINYLSEEKKTWEEELKDKTKIAALLDAIKKPIDEIAKPSQNISELPEKCLENVANKCQSVCKTGKGYGCHDALYGCTPDKCQGGNPCPTSEIKSQSAKIDSLTSQIKGLSNAIISAVDGIKKQREVKSIINY